MDLLKGLSVHMLIVLGIILRVLKTYYYLCLAIAISSIAANHSVNGFIKSYIIELLKKVAQAYFYFNFPAFQ